MSSQPLRNESQSREKLLRIRTSLKGRPVRTYTFRKEIITVGRNPEADVFLDNPGVSRDHLRIEVSPDGRYVVEDLGSANGTLLNDVAVQRQMLRENDVIRIGKYALWISYEEDRRGDTSVRSITPDANDGTVVLSAAELDAMMKRSQLAEVPRSAAEVSNDDDFAVPPRASSQGWREFLSKNALIAFAAGAAFGAAVVFLLNTYLKR